MQVLNSLFSTRFTFLAISSLSLASGYQLHLYLFIFVLGSLVRLSYLPGVTQPERVRGRITSGLQRGRELGPDPALPGGGSSVGRAHSWKGPWLGVVGLGPGASVH